MKDLLFFVLELAMCGMSFYAGFIWRDSRSNTAE